MSGRHSIRGYLIQTIICLLDALEQVNQWESLTLEPDIGSDKVDIVWFYKPNVSRVTQIKSSHNQISLTQAKNWASELERSINASNYELLLIGPCSRNVASIGSIGRVSIPTPKPLDLQGLMDQAAHRLGKYLDYKKKYGVDSTSRELIVGSLVTKLESYSTDSSPHSRED